MGCSHIKFSEADEEFRCLCTFPMNDGETLTPDRVQSLALLGAAVVLLHQGEVVGPVFLPDGLPGWIVDGVRRCVSVDDESENDHHDKAIALRDAVKPLLDELAWQARTNSELATKLAEVERVMGEV